MSDLLEGVLHLEDQFYKEGYEKGHEEGLIVGRIDGRSLGMQKGFEKFLESAKLYGKAIVWANRLPHVQASQDSTPENQQQDNAMDLPNETPKASQLPICRLPSLPDNPRLAKHISALHALVEPETLSAENSDEAVNDFDDRFRTAQGKAKLIAKMIGDENGEEKLDGSADSDVPRPGLSALA